METLESIRVKLAAGYLRAAMISGARLAAPVEVVDVECGAREVRAITRSGEYRAATSSSQRDTSFPDFVPLDGHRLISTFALATRPQPQRLWPEQCLVWEASDPYLYCRTTPDGRAILGGEDEDFVDEGTRDALLTEKVRTIGRKAHRLFPQLDVTPEFAWTGTFGTSMTGLPAVGPIPGRDGCWAVLGYGGNGITYSRIAAEIVRTTLAGGTDPDADLYAFAEFQITSRGPPPAVLLSSARLPRH